jgi:hypothetical protein
MLIIGCDFQTRYQQIAMSREETGELLVEWRLEHESGEAQAFYRSLQSSQEPVCVGIEATGPIHWFERLLAGCPSFGTWVLGCSDLTLKFSLKTERPESWIPAQHFSNWLP